MRWKITAGGNGKKRKLKWDIDHVMAQMNSNHSAKASHSLSIKYGYFLKNFEAVLDFSS